MTLTMVTPAYAAVFGFVFVILSVRTLRMRHRLQVGIGDGGLKELTRAIRVHANFAEYVPLTLLLLFFLEFLTDWDVLIHALSGALLVGRIVHAFGVSQVKENYTYRVCGMVLTFVALVGAAAAILVVYGMEIVAR